MVKLKYNRRQVNKYVPLSHLKQFLDSARGLLVSAPPTSPDLPNTCRNAGFPKLHLHNLNSTMTIGESFISSRPELAVV